MMTERDVLMEILQSSNSTLCIGEVYTCMRLFCRPYKAIHVVGYIGMLNQRPIMKLWGVNYELYFNPVVSADTLSQFYYGYDVYSGELRISCAIYMFDHVPAHFKNGRYKIMAGGGDHLFRLIIKFFPPRIVNIHIPYQHYDTYEYMLGVKSDMLPEHYAPPPLYS